MRVKKLILSGIAAAMVVAPVSRAQADADGLLGGIVGGIIGGVIVNEYNKNRSRTAYRSSPKRAYRPGIPATQQGRETQVALNYFGFSAGRIDGQVGPDTRAAIERYQSEMGYPVNGRAFADEQFDFLMEAYYWATSGAAEQLKLVGRPLLRAYAGEPELREEDGTI